MLKIFGNSDISYQDAERILLRLGYDLDICGSHHAFRKRGFAPVIIKRRTSLKTYQIDDLREVLIKHGYTKETL
jgi:hypothetical protein